MNADQLMQAGNQEHSNGNVHVHGKFPNLVDVDHTVQNSNEVGQDDASQTGPDLLGQVAGNCPATPGPNVLLNTQPNFNVGSKFTSRKRSRREFHNSPEDTPGSATVARQLNFDLNTRVDEAVEGRPVVIEGSGVQPVVVDPGVALAATPDEVIEEAETINSEVQTTIQVCSLVGMNLDNSCGRVADEIIAENELLGAQ